MYRDKCPHANKDTDIGISFSEIMEKCSLAGIMASLLEEVGRNKDNHVDSHPMSHDNDTAKDNVEE